jgi:radical SAM protein with 4Fe4S-binding SPASM domain
MTTITKLKKNKNSHTDLDKESIEFIEKLNNFLNKTPFPFNYEQQLLTDYPGLLNKIFSKEIMPPLHFEFLPTEKCNNNCVWCRGGHRNYMGSQSELSEKAMFGVIDELSNYPVKGIVRFSGMSGEPLMNKSTLPTIKKGIKQGLNIGLITNGILLNKESYDYLKGAKYVSVSLDAGTKKTFNLLKGHKNDTFNKILENIQGIVEFKRKNNDAIRLGVSYVIHKLNYKEIVTTTSLIKKIGTDMIQFKVPYDPSATAFSKEEIDKIYILLSEAKDMSDNNFQVMIMQTEEEGRAELGGKLSYVDFPKCWAHYLNGVIGADGNVYPCVHYYYNKGVSGQPLGNIYQQTFSQIWNNKERIKKISKINPNENCQFCNRFDSRINRFLNFIESKT